MYKIEATIREREFPAVQRALLSLNVEFFTPHYVKTSNDGLEGHADFPTAHPYDWLMYERVETYVEDCQIAGVADSILLSAPSLREFPQRIILSKVDQAIEIGSL